MKIFKNKRKIFKQILWASTKNPLYPFDHARDLPVLAEIWEAVSATHDFLFGSDFAEIKAMMPDYFDKAEV